MNQQEYEHIAEALLRHRKSYGGRTDSVAMQIIDEIADELEHYYDNFDRDKFNDIAKAEVNE